MVNGFVSADAWKFIVNVPAPETPPIDWPLRLPRPQEIREVEWIGNTFYYPVTRFELVFDGKESVAFSPKPNNDVQTFRVDPPRRARSSRSAWPTGRRSPARGRSRGSTTSGSSPRDRPTSPGASGRC